MNSVIKVSILTFALIAFLVTMCIFFSGSIVIQLIYFIGINLIFILIKGKKLYWRLAKSWYKFSILIIFIFSLSWLIFGLIHYNNYLCADLNFFCYKRWFLLGVITMFLLINSVFTIELIIFSITINDILSLPISIKYLKYFILSRTLLIQATARFDDNQLLIKTIPDFQPEYKVNFKNLKILFHKNIILALTFVMYIDQQSEVIGKLIDNRIKHNYKI